MMKILIKKTWEKIRNFDYKMAVKTFYQDALVFPIYILTHPIKGWDEFKYEKKGKMYVAVFYLIMMIIATAFAETQSGFLVSGYVTDFNLLLTALLIIVPVIMLTLGNWSVTALMEGKGNMREIFMMFCYSLMPYVILSIPLTIISPYLVQQELAFYRAIYLFATVLLLYSAFFGILVIHEYGLLKTVVTILLTLVAVAVIIFIIILLLTLFQTVWGFIKAVYEELLLRLS